MILFLCLLGIAGYLWYLDRLRLFRHWKDRGIAGPEPGLLFGNTYQYLNIPLSDKVDQWRKEYGDVFGFFAGCKPLWMVCDADMVKQIENNNFTSFVDRGTPVGEQPRSNSLVNLTGQRWKNVRSALTPSFTTSKLKGITENVVSIVDEFVELLSTKQGQKVDMYSLYKALTADVISRIALGVNYNCLNDPKNPVIGRMQKLFDLRLNYFIMLVISFPWVQKFSKYLIMFYESALNKEEGFTNPMKLIMEDCKKIVALRRSDPSARRSDILQLLLESKYKVGETTEDQLEMNEDTDRREDAKKIEDSDHLRGLTDSEIIDNATLILVAGYETTANTLASLTHVLVHYPEIQDALRKEIREKIGEGDVNLDSLRNLIYMDAVIKECQRLYSPLFITSREATQNCTINGVVFKKGDNICISIDSLHRNQEYWEDPEEFRPERFLAGYHRDVLPHAFQAFGGGPRNCIGMRFALMEIKLTLVQMLSKFSLNKADDSPKKLEMTQYMMVKRPAGAITCRLVPV